MLSYGFAIPLNPFDHFSVGLRVPPGSPLAQTRIWYRPDKKSDVDFQCYIFNTVHPRAQSASCLEAALFSFDLLDSISVLCANDREVQAMFEYKRTYISTTLASSSPNSKTKKKNPNNNDRNLLNTFTQLYRECEQRLGVLQKTDPTSMNGDLVIPTTPQQRYARIHRASQTEILATAMLLCQFTFLRARTGMSIKDATRTLSETSTSPSFHVWPSSSLSQRSWATLSTLVQHHRDHGTTTIQHHELFTFSELLSVLPQPQAQGSLLESLNPIQHHISSNSSTSATHRQHQRARLAALLAILRTQSADPLPPRFHSWLAMLNSWYGDASWNTLADDGACNSDAILALLTETVDSARTAAAATARKVNMPFDMDGLVWAWNVVGEESVQVPSGLMMPSSSGLGQGNGDDTEDGRDEDGVLMLYIPH